MIPLSTKRVLRKLGGDIDPSKTILQGQLTDGSFQSMETVDLVPGKKYTVSFGNESQKIEIGSAIAQELGGVTLLGNVALFDNDAPNTGETFLLITGEDIGDIKTLVIITENVYGYFIIEQSETIHPIDPKFLTTTINLDEYGIDLMSMFAAGGGNQFFEATGFWEKINEADGNVQFLTNVGVENFLIPSLKTYDSNMTFAWCVFGCSLMTSVEGQLVKADILFSYSNSGVSVDLKLA